MSLPKLLHRIWLGNGPVTEDLMEWEDGWRGRCPGWEFRVWSDEDVQANLEKFITGPVLAEIYRLKDAGRVDPTFMKQLWFGVAPDLLRYEIMRLYGGVYIDWDVEIRRPFLDHLPPDHFIYANELHGRPGSFFLASPPGHRVSRILCEGLAGFLEAGLLTRIGGTWDIPAVTGPEALPRALNAVTWSWTLEDRVVMEGDEIGGIYPGGVCSLWHEWACPYAWHDRDAYWRARNSGRDVESYGNYVMAHHWSGRWQ